MNRDNRFMAAALAVNEPRRDLIALRVEPQSIASQPVAEPEVGPAYFFRPAEPFGVNFSQTKNSALSSFFPERGWSSLFHNVIQNLIRSLVLLLIVPQPPFQLR